MTTARMPVIDTELANRIADHLESLGYNSPYAIVDWNTKPRITIKEIIQRAVKPRTSGRGYKAPSIF